MNIEIWMCDACGAASMDGYCPKCGLPRSGEATEILAEFFDVRASNEGITQTEQYDAPAPEVTGPVAGPSPAAVPQPEHPTR